MRKINSLLFYLCFLVLSVTAISAQKQRESPASVTDWVGEYKYTYTEGKTAGGSVPVIEYRDRCFRRRRLARCPIYRRRLSIEQQLFLRREGNRQSTKYLLRKGFKRS